MPRRSGARPEPLRVSVLAPIRSQCGVSDYSHNLYGALSCLAEPEVTIPLYESFPEMASRRGIPGALLSRPEYLRQYRTLAERFNASGAELLHIQHQFSLFGGAAPHRNFAHAFYNCLTLPVVLTVHEILEPSGSGLRRSALALANRANLIHPSIHAWIVHTRADFGRLKDLGAPAEAVHVIPIGIPEIGVLPDSVEARRRMGLDMKRVVTLFGFLSAKKGHLVALAALELLPEDVFLLFAGGKHPDDRSGYASRLEREIRERGLSHRARITGFLAPDELNMALAATDVAIAPYTASSGSASAAHLLAAGLPLITSNIPAFAEIEADTPGATLQSPAGDAAGLAQRISDVLSDPSISSTLRGRAREYTQRHSFAASARATAEVYVEVERAG